MAPSIYYRQVTEYQRCNCGHDLLRQWNCDEDVTA